MQGTLNYMKFCEFVQQNSDILSRWIVWKFKFLNETIYQVTKLWLAGKFGIMCN